MVDNEYSWELTSSLQDESVQAPRLLTTDRLTSLMFWYPTRLPGSPCRTHTVCLVYFPVPPPGQARIKMANLYCDVCLCHFCLSWQYWHHEGCRAASLSFVSLNLMVTCKYYCLLPSVSRLLKWLFVSKKSLTLKMHHRIICFGEMYTYNIHTSISC